MNMATHTTQKEFTGVKLYVDWTMASERANILTGAKTDDVHGEALATSMGKIAEWYRSLIPTGGAANNILVWSASGEATWATTLPSAALPSHNHSASQITSGTLGIARGGTGKGSVTANAVLLGNGTSALKEVANASGVFLSDGSTAPHYGTVPITAGGTGATSAADARTNLDIYSKTEVDTAIANSKKDVVKIKGVVAATSNLPTTNNNIGDLYYVGSGTDGNAYTEYIWVDSDGDDVGDKWESIGQRTTDLPDATTSQKGIVQLSSATNSSSETLAATPKAVKAAYDLANGKSTVSYSQTLASSTSGAYEIGKITINGTATTIYGKDTNTTYSTGVGLTSSGTTFKAKLKSETALTADSTAGTGSKIYAVQVDKSGNLAVTVPWTDTNTQVTQNVFTGDGKDYPLLLGYTGATASTTGATTTSNETNTVKKNTHLYVNVTSSNATTVYADMFEGGTSDTTAGDSSSKIANTKFVTTAITNAITQCTYTQGDGILISSNVISANFASVDADKPKANGTQAIGTSTKVARADHVHPLQTTISGNAGSATKLQTGRAIDGVTFDGQAAITHYGTCSTAAGTVAKTVDLTSFTLVTGSRIIVKFTVTNTGAVGSLTLNVNSTGAKSIKYRNGNLPSAGTLSANRFYEFVYDGTYWQLVGDLDTNSTYSVVTATANGLVGAPTTSNSGMYYKQDSNGKPDWVGDPVEVGDELIIHCVA